MAPPVGLEAIRELYSFNRWAHERVLAMAQGLREDQLVRDLGTSHGSVAGTLVHTMWAEWIWLRRWRGESPRVAFHASEFPSVGSIRERWDGIWADQKAFLDALTAPELLAPAGYVNLRGERWTYPLWQELLHVVNHGSYHRGQVVTLLRQLGRPALPTDLLVFYDEKEQ